MKKTIIFVSLLILRGKIILLFSRLASLLTWFWCFSDFNACKQWARQRCIFNDDGKVRVNIDWIRQRWFSQQTTVWITAAKRRIHCRFWWLNRRFWWKFIRDGKREAQNYLASLFSYILICWLVIALKISRNKRNFFDRVK